MEKSVVSVDCFFSVTSRSFAVRRAEKNLRTTRLEFGSSAYDGGPNPRFDRPRVVIDDAAFAGNRRGIREGERAYHRPWPPHPPRTTRGSCPRRARTPPRLSKRIENVRGVSSSEGRERSRLAYGIRCAFFRVPRGESHLRASRERLRTSPDGPVGGAEPAFAQALVPFDDDIVRLEARQVRALLVDLRDRLGELGVVLRRREGNARWNETWEVSRCGSRRGAAGVDARASRTRRGRGYAMTDTIKPDTRR